MTDSEIADVLTLVAAARGVYRDDPAAQSVLGALEERLREPLRVAVAGIVKAGKSTLLNALLGERIAPTDAGECTRVVTWYRYADVPSITVHPHGARAQQIPVRRTAGRLVLDLGRYAAEDVDHIEVHWPSRMLRTLTLIDTPGIASLSQDLSARSLALLTPEESPSSADAILYLIRHLHASDLKFLEAFRDTAAGTAQTVNALAVLSRADEIGSGRIDSLLSARRVAERYERDGMLSSLALGVMPVAGLLAEGARTLRESEFASFRTLAQLERVEREPMLVSADRFVNTAHALPEASRRELLDRFGIFGVRLATSLIRGGADDSSVLAEQLVAQSGLNELVATVRMHFRSRAPALKARAVCDALTQLIAEKPRPSTDEIEAGIEKIQVGAHGLRELALLGRIRTGDVTLPPALVREAERIIGGAGDDASLRLGLPPDSDGDALRARLDDRLDHWRAVSASPLVMRDGVQAARTVVRSLERIASEIGCRGADATDVVTAGGPGDGPAEGAQQQRQKHEAALQHQRRSQQGALWTGGRELDHDQVQQQLHQERRQLPPSDTRAAAHE
ncbi:dynamin family protein [Microbacterium horticulturae]|uniref:Dynamin family protein n=1 Tax=Microbacterium horticulturae TaxID=3028316 RepID=A0ABY8BZ44_9MICO|nr:dynamin family protein [Microbacterium sp. KACC 23027]WEG08116.1 dynamin family protein [Microbacterium sp. KACC 23027]